MLTHFLSHNHNHVAIHYPPALCSALILLLFFPSSLFFLSSLSCTTTETLSVEAQRGLILISKLLQNLSNGIEFEDSKKEYVPELNQFLSENSKKLHHFFEKLAVWHPSSFALLCLLPRLPFPTFHLLFIQDHDDSVDAFKSLYSVSSEAEQHAINTITAAMKENQQKIFSLLVKVETKKVSVIFVWRCYCNCGVDVAVTIVVIVTVTRHTSHVTVTVTVKISDIIFFLVGIHANCGSSLVPCTFSTNNWRLE